MHSHGDPVRHFYDDLAADYDLIYPDWNAEIERQGGAIHTIIRDRLSDRMGDQLGGSALDVLDCACGIGTQALGLAARGHRVAATDLSERAARRAAAEAGRRGVALLPGVADMRRLPFADAAVDVVLCADNSVSHLATPDGLLAALRQMHRVLRPGGLLVLTVRSEVVRRTHPTTGPVGVTHTPAGRVITFQLWTWQEDGEHYDMEHIQLHPSGDSWQVRVRRAPSWALLHDQLGELVEVAGFEELSWLQPEQSGFFQPVLTARRPSPG